MVTKSRYPKYLKKIGVRIGEGCEIYKTANFGSEPYLITIGNHVRINAGVHLVTHDGGCWVLRDKNAGYGEEFLNADCFGPITIEDNVHIGTNAIIMPGVHIGRNAIVGCGAIVTRDVPSGMVVAGVPARVIETTEEYATKMARKMVSTKNMTAKEKKNFLLKKYNID